MRKRQLTPGYIFFYILFLRDTWQILTGIIAASFLTPAIKPEDIGRPGEVVLFIMIAVIGYVASAPIGRGITRILKKWILGDKQV